MKTSIKYLCLVLVPLCLWHVPLKVISWLSWQSRQSSKWVALRLLCQM